MRSYYRNDNLLERANSYNPIGLNELYYTFDLHLVKKKGGGGGFKLATFAFPFCMNESKKESDSAL